MSDIIKVKKIELQNLMLKPNVSFIPKQLGKCTKAFWKSNRGLQCSFTKFFRYKSFNLTPPTEQEKESCLGMKCQNVHLLLKGINTLAY